MDIYTFAQMYIGVLPGGAGLGRCCESSSSRIERAERTCRLRGRPVVLGLALRACVLAMCGAVVLVPRIGGWVGPLCRLLGHGRPRRCFSSRATGRPAPAGHVVASLRGRRGRRGGCACLLGLESCGRRGGLLLGTSPAASRWRGAAAALPGVWGLAPAGAGVWGRRFAPMLPPPVFLLRITPR